MAELILGAGTSHSPMLLLDAAGWRTWADERDPGMDDLHDADGAVHSFEQWVERNGDRLRGEITEEAFTAKIQRCDAARDALRNTMAEADLDALVIVGDDQGEHLGAENLPPVLVHHGAELTNSTSPLPETAPAILRTVMEGYYETDGEQRYPVDVELADHLIDHLLDGGFDIATSATLPADRPEGHAFQYVHRHLLPPELPTVAVMLNTYMPPAQPRAKRCVQLGQGLAAAIAAMPGDRRVGVIASGGLSHFIVDEDLDRTMLAACKAHDLDVLAGIPEHQLQSGSSEIKNWITVAAACTHLDFALLDYVPGYRTLAGTGTALAFATWSQA